MSVTTDNAKNMVNGIEFLINEEKNSSIFHTRCSAHVLNLAVKSGLECDQINVLISKIRKVCKKIHVSTRLSAELTSNEKAYKEQELSVVLDIEIRWNSTFEMLDRAIKIRKSLIAISINLKEEKPDEDILLENEDFEKASIVLNLLEPFKQSKYLQKLN